MERAICLVIGYVFGLFQTAYLYGKLHGIDIRNYGSGNAGTTNTLRTLGTKAGLIVLLGDIMKCILAIVLTNLLFQNSHPDEIYLLKIYAAAGAILGHNFPFYLHFKGGKGIAATAGMILSFHPWLIPMGDFVLRHLFYDALCVAGVAACLCGIYDRAGSAGTDGDLRYAAGGA